jgi:hypothetical protein
MGKFFTGKSSIAKTVVLASLTVVACTGGAMAQRDTTDRSIINDLNRERAETRIERLKQDQREREERSAPRARQKKPYGVKKPSQPR